MIMKSLTLLFILLGSISFAQRNPYSNMFWNNYAHINPAMSGMEHKIHGSVLYRNQWPALSQSYHTTFVNANMRIGDNHGVGINYITERFDPCRAQQINANYNYQLTITDDSRLSVGIAATYFTSRCNSDYIIPGDAASSSFNQLNANIGVAYIWKELLVHGSVNNLLNNSMNFINNYNFFYNNSKTFNLGASYNISLGERFALKAQLLSQYSNGFSRIDVNALFSFDDKCWIGASFANRNHFGFMAGVNIYEKIRLGYSYDKTVSKLSNGVSGGSHEVSIGYYLK